MTTHRVLVHTDGPALWPAHKPLSEVLELKATTPELVWSATYQGSPTPPGGYTFKRSWWAGRNRYDSSDRGWSNQAYGRYISFDTAMKDTDDSDLTAWTVAEVQPDYMLNICGAGSDKLEFPDLPEVIVQVARRWNFDGKLRGIIIEDRVSGTSAIQTIRATVEDLAGLVAAFVPTTDKLTRANQAAVWCKNDCILLPKPRPDQLWLIDLEEDLYTFPQSAYLDRVDSLTQLVLYLENIIEHGYKARKGEENGT